jgi:hypothetical protein
VSVVNNLRPTSRLHTLFLAGIGAIALHVLDDSFVQPQPGTSAGDHLVSGLVPLALLALSAWAYPRLREGSRAALALLWAFPAALSGVEAVYYSGHGGLSGDDYTGLLAIGAAPVLLGVGVMTLWRSRPLGDHLVRRYGRTESSTVRGYGQSPRSGLGPPFGGCHAEVAARAEPAVARLSDRSRLLGAARGCGGATDEFLVAAES